MSRDPAVFTGVVSDEGRVVFDFPTQVKAYVKHYAGQCVDVTIAPAGHVKTRQQEKGFHAMIRPWAHDEGHAINDLKHDLLRAIFGEREDVNLITGEVTMRLQQPHTSKLNRAQYCELVERTMQIAAECGVVLVAPDEYRKAREVTA
jgi:hypothetical protein